MRCVPTFYLTPTPKNPRFLRGENLVLFALHLSIFNSQFSIPYVVVWHTWTLFLSANYQPLAVAPDTKQGRNYVHLKFPKWHEPNVPI